MAVNKNEISTQVKEGMKEGLNLQEISWCETYLRTLSISQACKESGLKLKEAQEITQKTSVIQYIMIRSDQYRKSLEKDREEELNREKIAKILSDMILNPMTKDEIRLSALSKLNEMRQFDKTNEIKGQGSDEESSKIKITAEEADKILEEIRSKCK